MTMEEKLKKILFNLTLNYEKCGYKIFSVFDNNIEFINPSVPKNERGEASDFITISAAEVVESYDSKPKYNVFKPSKRYMYSGCCVLDSPTPTESETKTIFTIRMCSFTYDLELNRLDTAKVLDAMEQMSKNYQDAIISQVYTISEAGEEKTVENLD